MSTHPALALVGNLLSISAIAGAVMGIVPPIATVASLIWFCLEIWESETVQKWIRLHRHKKRRKRVAHRKGAHHVAGPVSSPHPRRSAD